jgi:GT2 family glycosyltransferase
VSGMGGVGSAEADAALPTATVVVPTYNRPAQLLACLATLAALDYPRERYEVVVVNDGGVLPDEGGIAALRERLRLTIVAQPNAGPAAARNRGAAHAGGEILAFTDDDCAPESGWLRELAASLTVLPAAMVGGRTVNALAGDPCAEASQLLIDYLYAYYGRPGSHRFFCSNNFAVGTPMFREIGGFDAGFARAAGEDRDLCDRWAARGWEMVYAPEAVVRHAHAMTLGDFARQHFAYGRGAYPFRQARAQRGQEPPRVEPLGFYARLVAYPFAAGARWRAPHLAALLAVAQAANAAGFMYEKRRRSTG